MNNKELTKPQDFEREALVFSLKKRIRKGVRIPLAEGVLKAKKEKATYKSTISEV